MALDKLQLKRINSPLINYKSILIKADTVSQDGRTVKGYGAVFGNKDSYDDIIIKGAFAKSIQERGPDAENGNNIAFCWQHVIQKVLGVITVLKEDDFGLYFEATFDTDQLAEETLNKIKSGSLKQFSIGFNYVWDKMEYDSTIDAFICKELILVEISVVTMAANPLAMVEGVKAEDIEDLRIKNRKELDEELRGLKHEKAYRLKQLISESMALAGAQPLEALREAKRAASTSDKALDFGAICSNF